MNEIYQRLHQTEVPFRVVKGLEKNIPDELYEGYLYFTTDTKKIYLDTAQQRLSMGGNSGIYYGDADFGEVDTDQRIFSFNIDEIDGNFDKTQSPVAIPNLDDLILNTDGCFYRVEGLTGEGWNIKIKTIKLTIAGSGGGGGGSVISLLITDIENSFSKHFTQDATEAKIKFIVNQKRGPEDNEITSVKYSIGNIDTVIKNEEHEMGHTFEFDLLPYISRMSTSNSTVLTVTITDAYGTVKSATYYINVIALSLTSEIKNNILMTTTGIYEYQCKPIGGTTLNNRQLIIEYYNQYNTLLKTETKEVKNSNTTIFYNLDFIKKLDDDKTANLGLGVYGIKIFYTGYIPGTNIVVPSNFLEYRVVYYSENPMLVSYLTKYTAEQFSTLSVEYMVAANIQTDEEIKINLIISGSGMEDKVIQRKVTYNSLKVWNIYFDVIGTYNLTIEIDGTSESIRYEGIQVIPYENSEIPIINPSRCDLYLSAINRSNDEVDKEKWEFQKTSASDLITTDFENFAWGDINGWLSKTVDEEKGQIINFLRLSSKAKATINFEPFKNVLVNNTLSDAFGTGLTIELDFMLSGVTDFTKPLISCLSYIDPDAENKEIQVGFQITGQESTFNTQNITSTGASILEGDDSATQAYNTKIQGLTAKFIENERIHLTWVVERKTNKFPMIRTYLNGKKSGITQYGNYDEKTNQVIVSDSLLQNPNSPAKIIFDSTYGTVDVYNVRVYQQALEDIDILNNYIATLDTPEQRANKYEDNLLLQDGIIDFKTITNGTYKLSVPYITITGGESLTKAKDDQPFGGQYYLNTTDTTSHLPFAKKDYRLIKHFEFVDQTGKHPNREYTSTFIEKQDQGQTREILNGLIMYGQGTSSMEYPVKNLRIKWKMKDENGNKIKFTVNSDDCPVDIVCCKADYMESSGSHNTGTANLIYDLLNDINLTTPAQAWYDSKVDYSIVTTIRGYPVLIFYRPSENDDYEFIGKYNLNLDKASSEPFGFMPDPEEKPEKVSSSTFGWGESDENVIETIHCYEFLNNADALTNFLTPTEIYGYLRDGQYVQAQTYEEICKSNYRLVNGVWQEVTNEDGKHCPLWFNSYESRYPEGEEDDGSDIKIDSFLRLCSWINSTDTTGLTGAARREKINKFKNEASQYLNIKFTTFYYVLTHLLLMIDSRAKNMMIATWDNTIWYPIFYDMDTMLGLNNYGYNKFNYDIEDTDANVYNGQNSVLWNNFREAFPNEIRDMYNQLQQNSKLNYEGILSVYGELQADAVNEAVYNADSYYKYVRPFSEGYYNSVTGDLDWVEPGTKDYLYASQGSRSLHRKWWVQNRLNYLNGKYLSDNFKNDRYIMRLYTPEADEINFVEVGQITEIEFNQGEFYIRTLIENEDGTTSYDYTEAINYDENEFYFKIDSSKINESIEAVVPNNNFTLTPLYNQYLAVAYGGSNGTTVGPEKGAANTPMNITTQQSFNDTETYIYGGSNLKDLGDLSSQYLGAFKFPDKTTKLERLTLGNLNNKYYNPNFSSLTIGSSAPYLSELNISNCIGLSRQDLNLFNCNNLKKVLATGSGLTGITFAEHGVLEELRLPSTLRTLKLIDQPHLTNNKFTIGTYNSDSESYSINDYSKLLHICLNDVPNINTYQMVLDLQSSKAFQSYCFKNVNWSIQNTEDFTTTNIKVLDVLKNKQTFADFVGTQPLTGTLTFSKEITANFDGNVLLSLYKNYVSLYPELYFNFEDTNKVNTVKIISYDDSIDWENKIVSGNKITSNFLEENGPKKPYVLTEYIRGNKYTYSFQDKWYIIKQENWDRYTNKEINKQELLELSEFIINAKQPISDFRVLENIVIIPEYQENLNTYTIKFYNGDGSLMEEKEVDYGTEFKNAQPQIDFPYKLEQNGEHFSLYEGYNFIGYGFSANDTIPIDDKTPITSDSNYYALFNKVTDLRQSNLHYEDFFNFTEIISPDGSGEQGYRLSPKYQQMHGKIVIPAFYNGKKIMEIVDFSDSTGSDSSNSNQQISHVLLEKNSHLYRIGSDCFRAIKTLVYFDFIPSIKVLGARAFNNCSNIDLKYFQLNEGLEIIEENCFRGALGANNQLTDSQVLKIPASIKEIRDSGFRYLTIPSGLTLEIGTAENNSPLDLSKVNLSNNEVYLFNQNAGNRFAAVNFYSQRYNSADDYVVGELIQVKNYFGQLLNNAVPNVI